MKIMSLCLLIILTTGAMHVTNLDHILYRSPNITDTTSAEEILHFSSADTNLTHPIFIHQDEGGHPIYFLSKIHTPVCIDNLCKPVSLDICWDLSGQYLGYVVRSSDPLTKFDHEHFLPGDYEKLHQLLSDQHSALSRKTIDELLSAPVSDTTHITYRGIVLDALSGATLKAVKNQIVEGALFSCHTLWHIAHGVAQDSIKAYLRRHPQFIEHLLKDPSNNNYAMTALQLIPADSIYKWWGNIQPAFAQGNGLLRNYLLKKLPSQDWKKEDITKGIYHPFDQLDINTRSRLISSMAKAHQSAWRHLVKHTPLLPPKLLEKYLTHVPTYSNHSDPHIQKLVKLHQDDALQITNSIIQKNPWIKS